MAPLILSALVSLAALPLQRPTALLFSSSAQAPNPASFPLRPTSPSHLVRNPKNLVNAVIVEISGLGSMPATVSSP
jgi:hypothetical protein